MKVSAYIRKTNNKEVARIYIRLRDENVDIKAATELSINPKYWDPVRQGYRPKVALVRESDRQKLNDAITDLCRTVATEYYKGADSDWLKKIIFVFHHPNAYKLMGEVCQETRLTKLIHQYVESKDFDTRQACVNLGTIGKIERFEMYKQHVKDIKAYSMNIDTITRKELEEFYRYLVDEHQIAKEYPKLYKPYGKMPTQKRSDNTLKSVFTRLRTVINWCIDKASRTTIPSKV